MSKEPAALVRDLRKTLRPMACAEHAAGAQRYMKSEMPYYGIKTEALRKACNEVFARHPLDGFGAWRDAVLTLYRGAKHREERYAAIQLTGLDRYADHQDEPYRQRVYHVTRVGGDLFESAVYSLPEDASWTGAWRNPGRFDAISAGDLEARDGCAILLRPHEGTFTGSTLGRLCTSSLRGATFATSEVVITEDELISWDRGFNDAGEQVWGAVKGGYVFSKLEDYRLE